MKSFLLSIILCFGFLAPTFGQKAMIEPKIQESNHVVPPPNMTHPSYPYGQMITAKGLKAHLSILASDEFEGRETCTAGQKKAARYIATHFRSVGIPGVGETNSYFQNVPYLKESWKKIDIQVNGQEFSHMKDFFSFSSTNTNVPELKASEVVFIGYGISDPAYDDYAKANVKGKVVMFYEGEPKDKDGNYFISGTTETSDWSKDWKKKLITAKEKGAKTVLIVTNETKTKIGRYRRFLVGGNLKLGGEDKAEKYVNSCNISADVAKAIIGKKAKKFKKIREKIIKKKRPYGLTLPCDIVIHQEESREDLIGENVMGFIEGSDPDLKNEIIYITAHYDHLGKRGEDIFNGADDNASGTSTLLEIAEAFAKAKKDGNGPRRSVMIMLVAGEEKGLLGSEYYVNNPVFPLENAVVDLNVDMVGRIDKRHEGNPDYVYVIGSDRLSTKLHDINEEANSIFTQLELDYKYNERDDPNRYYYRSDHYNFAERGIPAAFYFNGTHEDYHRSTDTPEKIEFDKMAKIGQLVFHTAWEISNRDERIIVDVVEEKK